MSKNKPHPTMKKAEIPNGQAGQPPRLKDTLRDLYEDHPLNSPKLAFKEWNEGTERPLPSNIEGIRREMIAISAYFIQKIWKSVEHTIETNPPGASDIIIDKKAQTFSRAPSIDKQKLSPFLGKTPQEAIIVINEWMSNTLTLGMQEVWNKLILDDEKPTQSQDLKAYRRYEHLLSMSGRRQADPADHIRRGIAVALRIIGSYFGHVNEAFQTREKRPITPAEAKQILKNSAQTIRLTAGMYVNTLNELEELMSDSDQDRLYAADSIILVGKSDDLRLEPAPDLHINLSETPEVPGQRIGCPALAAKDKEGKSVIDGLFNWYMKMADEFYFPRLAEFIENTEIRKRAGV